MKNPWPGLSSYTEESLKEYQFNGRSAASAALSALIRRNLFVTLYGRSGIGKTSLLQAGVYPLLRGEGMCPVTIRLNEIKTEIKKGDAPIAKLLWNQLLLELNKVGVQYQPCDDSDIYVPEFTDTMALRNIFSAGRFKNTYNEEVTPVIVFDQFEEVLYKAPEASRLLVSQLYALIDDNYNLTIPHPTWHEDTIFRIVVSIREDDLFLFEDCIDILNCVDFKSNRYRLMPLTEEEAKEVIMKPAEGIFDANEKTEIVKEIMRISCNKSKNINTLMLSLLCHVLYDKYAVKGEAITKSALSNYDDIIKVYYLSILKEKKLPQKEIYYLEDNLIDDQGRRKSIYLSDLKKYAPKTHESELKESKDDDSKCNYTNNRLLNISQNRVEFIHDQLAASVYKIRTSRKTKKSRRLGIGILIVALIVLFLVSLSFVPDRAKEHDLSTETCSLHNNTKVRSFTVLPNDSNPPYYIISDCPNLKTIEIKKQRARLLIYNCPNLVNIIYPEDYIGNGNIVAYNCANIVENEKVSKKTLRDSDYKSESLPDINRTGIIIPGYSQYDSVCNSYTIYGIPSVYRNEERYRGESKVWTNIPDSLKRVSICYVPYGYSNKFSQLYEFQPFHRIEELPIYYTWAYHIKSSLIYLEHYKQYLYLLITFLMAVQLFFLFTAYNLYRNRISKLSLRFLFTFQYGFGMSAVVLLAFLAFYWFVFDVLVPWNQKCAIIIGVIGSLICMAIVYKKTFFYVFEKTLKTICRRIKTIGLIGYVSEMPHHIANALCGLFKRIKKHPVKYIGIIIGCCSCAYLFNLNLYVQGKEKRMHYLEELNHIHFAKVPIVVDALVGQHGSILYPFFTDSLNNIKRQLNDRNYVSTAIITPKYINDLAKSQGINLNATRLFLESFSQDENRFCLRLIDDFTDISQAIYFNFISEKIDTITPKTSSVPNSVFSPSGNTIISICGEIGYAYSVLDGKLVTMSHGFDNRMHGENIRMKNDLEYYYIHDNNLYQGNLNSILSPYKVSKNSQFSRCNLHIVDSANVMGVNLEHCFIYNISQDSITYRAKGFYYDIRGFDSRYVATKQGLLDIKKDSIVFESDNIYMWNRQPIEILKEENRTILRGINGKVIKVINKDIRGVYAIRIGNNYLYQRNASSLCIYNLNAKFNQHMIITDYDKKVFDLE